MSAGQGKIGGSEARSSKESPTHTLFNQVSGKAWIFKKVVAICKTMSANVELALSEEQFEYQRAVYTL